MEYTPVTVESFTIVGVPTRINRETAKEDVHHHWKKFLLHTLGHRIPNTIDDAIYAVYSDFRDGLNGPYSMILGKKVSSADIIPRGMVQKTVESGPYAHFTVTGPAEQNVWALWEKITASDIPLAFETDFEIYPSSFDVLSPDVKIQVYAGLKD